MRLSEAELQELASHLRCPKGKEGLKVAAMMNSSNANIIAKTVATLVLTDGDKVLEIGPGNGLHAADVINAAADISYSGIDISETMVVEAQKLNKNYSNVNFSLTNGESVPFDDSMFDKVFTVNTIYFWKDPESYIGEIARVLKVGGLLSIGYIPLRIMEKIPFAKYGFTKYTESTVTNLLEDSGFIMISGSTHQEFIPGINGESIEREFVIASAKKI